MGLFLQDFKADSTLTEFPRAFPFTRVISPAELTAKGNLLDEKTVVLDVRSADEATRDSVASKFLKLRPSLKLNIVNLPYESAPQNLAVPSYKVVRSQLSADKFDVSQFLKFRDQKVIVVGADSKDSRAIFALDMLVDAGFRNLVWLYDGSASLK